MISSFANSAKLPQISSIDYSKANDRLIVSANGIGINVYDVSALSILVEQLELFFYSQEGRITELMRLNRLEIKLR